MDAHPQPGKPYRTDVRDEEWAVVAPDLALMTRDAPPRHHDLREVFNALRWIVRTGAPWALSADQLPAVGSGLPADAALAR